MDALEEVKRRAEGLGHGGLDGVGVGHGHDDLSAMALHQPDERGRHARLHLEKGLPAGEAESARVLLDDRPFRAACRLLERQPGEFTDVDLEQAALDAHGEMAGAGDGERRLPGALERRGVDGGDLGERADSGAGLVRLPASLVGEMKPGGPPGELHARGRREPVAHQEDQRRLVAHRPSIHSRHPRAQAARHWVNLLRDTSLRPPGQLSTYTYVRLGLPERSRLVSLATCPSANAE